MKKVLAIIMFILLISTVSATTVTLDAASGPGTGFDNQFIFDYDYNDATVTVEFDDIDDNFRAHVVATGLKPSFTYQLKFEGQGSLGPYPDTNELIGLNGRWWYSGNRDDTYYWANKDSQNIIGYLVFDYFTTDSNGEFDGYVETTDSYHVLYCDDDLSGNGDLYPISSEPAYSGETLKCSDSTLALCPADSVFGQVERPGFTGLPDGEYEDVIFVLNEESFHVSCGTWTTAMTKEISFEIDSEANVCGNDIYEPENNEECDNGVEGNRDNMQPVWNLEQGEGDRNYCSTDCEIYSVPGIWCGDDIVNGPEECDDGNNQDGDGCSAICEIEEQLLCDVSLDYVNIGDPTSEEGHDLIGWSVINGNWNPGDGSYGGGPDDETFRLLMGAGDGCGEDFREAYLTFNVGDNLAETITFEHLDGSQPDNFEVYVWYEGDWELIGTYTQQTDSEDWVTSTYNLPEPMSGDIEVMLYLTSPQAGWCTNWGQTGFSWGEVTGCETPDDIPEFTVIGSLVVLGLAGMFVYKRRK